MKFEVSEQVKYRLTGVVVVLAVALIFIPAMLKKQNHHFVENMNLSVKLPAKPVPPKVNIVTEKTLFNSVKVAKADLPIVVAPHVSQLAIAEPISRKSVVPAAPILTSKIHLLAKANTKIASVASASPAAAKRKLVNKTVASNKEVYSVQLASFTQQTNAKVLVDRLRSKGYKASYNKFSGKRGEYYQVLVGELSQKEAQILQKKLADSLQLNGFVVKKGVG